jgi:uncharacterized protein (DUF697 family)
MDNKLEPDLVRLIDEKLQEALKKRGRVNILIAGKTGVGKSTLINAVFQGDLATTGQGRPVTENTREIKKEGIPISIFDTRGLELEKFKESVAALTAFLDERARRDDPNEHIHCAWICVSEDGRRVEDGEINLCRALAPRMPVVIVITKARSDQGFRNVVQNLLPLAVNVVRVRAIREVFDDGQTLEPFGLRELVDLTMEIVPQGQKNAFAAAQKVVLRHKQDRAHLIVGSAVLAAGGVGAAPIPFADAYLLVPIQISMLSGITAAFGLPLSTSFLTTLVSSTFAGMAGTIGGRAVVGGLLLLIPGAGVFLKGLICASTAVAITTAFGESYIAALSALIEKDPGHPPTADQIGIQLKEELRKRNPFK